jgi:hypothetical protein
MATCWLAAACNLETSPRMKSPDKAETRAAVPTWQPASKAAARDEPQAGHVATGTEPDESQHDGGAGGAGSRAEPATMEDAGRDPRTAAELGHAGASGGSGGHVEAGGTGSKPPAETPAAGTPAAGAVASAPPTEAQATSTACQPGMYSGAFTGSIQLIGLSLSSVTGTIRARLELDASKQTLSLQEARIQGVDQSENQVTGLLTGTLDCRTRMLMDGRLENGNYHGKDDKQGTAFSGTTQASYASDPPSATGTWQASADSVQVIAGQGTWSLVFTGSK